VPITTLLAVTDDRDRRLAPLKRELLRCARPVRGELPA
jgi:hypothetical protein